MWMFPSCTAFLSLDIILSAVIITAPKFQMLRFYFWNEISNFGPGRSRLNMVDKWADMYEQVGVTIMDTQSTPICTTFSCFPGSKCTTKITGKPKISHYTPQIYSSDSWVEPMNAQHKVQRKTKALTAIGLQFQVVAMYENEYITRACAPMYFVIVYM